MTESISEIKEVDGITVVRLMEKKLYQNAVTRFQDEMVKLLDGEQKRFVIDLSDVEVMNSSGLGVLILMWDRLKKEDGRLALMGLCPLMEDLFQRMRLNLIFKIAQTQSEAVEMIQGV